MRRCSSLSEVVSEDCRHRAIADSEQWYHHTRSQALKSLATLEVVIRYIFHRWNRPLYAKDYFLPIKILVICYLTGAIPHDHQYPTSENIVQILRALQVSHRMNCLLASGGLVLSQACRHSTRLRITLMLRLSPTTKSRRLQLKSDSWETGEHEI